MAIENTQDASELVDLIYRIAQSPKTDTVRAEMLNQLLNKMESPASPTPTTTIVTVTAAQIRAWATVGIEILPDLPAGSYYKEWKVFAEYDEGVEGQFTLPNIFTGKYIGGSTSEGSLINNDFIFDGVIQSTAFFLPQLFSASGNPQHPVLGKAPWTEINKGIRAYLFDLTSGPTDFATSGAETGVSIGTLRFIAEYTIAAFGT